MSEMIPNNPVKNNGLPQVGTGFGSCRFRSFYALGCFFVRAWKLVTWNLNMFTLIGIGSGVFYLACLAYSFQNSFQMIQNRKRNGTSIF
jgi:Cu2+-exporting ATPase